MGMSMARRTLRPWAVWLMLVLLFALWATASYACPRQSAAASPAVAADLPPCHGAAPPSVMDADQPQLCKAHCQQGGSGQSAPGPGERLDAQRVVLLWAVIDWRHRAAAAAGAASRSRPSRRRRAAPGSPPIYLSLLVLRN